MQWGYISVPPCGRRKKHVGMCATKTTGMVVDIATSQGVLEVWVYRDDLTGKDVYSIIMLKHGGKGVKVGGALVGNVVMGFMGESKKNCSMAKTERKNNGKRRSTKSRSSSVASVSPRI